MPTVLKDNDNIEISETIMICEQFNNFYANLQDSPVAMGLFIWTVFCCVCVYIILLFCLFYSLIDGYNVDE